MSATKKALAAAAVLGLAGALLSPPALAILSTGSEPGRSIQALHPGIFLAEAAKKKATKAKRKATKAKKPGSKSKGVKGPGTTSSGSGEYD